MVKKTLYGILYHTKILHLYQTTKGRKTGIVSYHNVLANHNFSPSGRYYTDFSEEVFEYQIRFLKSNFSVQSFTDQQPDFKKNGFYLSFDDGMLNNFHIILPILRKYNIKAMFAVCPDLVNGIIPHIWRDHFYLILQKLLDKTILLPIDDYKTPFKLTFQNISLVDSSFKEWIYKNKVADIYEVLKRICYANKIAYQRENVDPLRFQPMSWNQIRQLQSEGHQIVSHTNTHKILSFLSDDENRYELLNSRQQIENQIDTPVTTIVYPYGNIREINDRVISIASECGYKSGYLNTGKFNSTQKNLSIPRFGLPFSKNLPLMYTVVSGLPDYVKDVLKRIRW